MNEGDKKLDDAMKRVYGSDRPVTTEKIEKELENIGKEPETSEEVGELKEKTEEKAQEDVKEEVKSPPTQPPTTTTTTTTTKEAAKEAPSEEALVVSANPHITDTITINRIMWLVVLALLPATIAAVYFFKLRAFLIILISVITAIATEFIIFKLTKKEISRLDGSAVITGLLLALILPPTVPLWLPILGVIFAIAIGKQIFGGLGHNIFNPALVGRAFLVASFPALMIRWILPDGVTSATPLGMLKLEGIKTAYSNLFLGNIGGCIGETSAVALLIGASFLLYKKIIDWRTPITYIGAVFVLALLFRQDPLFHILAGGLLIGAFFMATDYVTAPITKNGRLIFGFGCGFLTIIIRLYSGLAEGVMYSILLMNALTPLIDRFTKPRPFGFQTKKELEKIKKEKQEELGRKKKVEEMLKNE